MGLIDKLESGGASNQSFNGKKPNQSPFSTPQSNLHNTFSLNGQPQIASLKASSTPSSLDLDGKTPAKYLDNPPR